MVAGPNRHPLLIPPETGPTAYGMPGRLSCYMKYHPPLYQVGRSILRHYERGGWTLCRNVLSALGAGPRLPGPNTRNILLPHRCTEPGNSNTQEGENAQHAALGRLGWSRKSAGVISPRDSPRSHLFDPTREASSSPGLPASGPGSSNYVMGSGFSSRDAAQELGVSPKAVEKQRVKLEKDLRRCQGATLGGGRKKLGAVRWSYSGKDVNLHVPY